MASSPFTIGPWLVEPARLRLTDDRGSKTVAPRVMELLTALASAEGDVMSRDDLHQRVWNGSAVGEDALRRAIFDLRRALGDSAQTPVFVETVPRRGYRLRMSIERPATVVSPPSTPSVMRRRRRGAIAMLMLLSALTAGVLVVFTARWFTNDPPATNGVDPTYASTLAAVRPLTSQPGAERMPTLSRDGRHVAFVGTSPDGGVDLWWQHLDADAPSRLTADAAIEAHPAWSPGGDRLAWGRHDADGWHVVVRALASGSPRTVARLAGDERLTGLAWSPVAEQLALGVSSLTESSRIALLDLADGTRRWLSEPPGTSLGDARPTFAPDGRRIAFVRVRVEGVHAIHVAETDPDSVADPAPVASFDGKVPGLAWVDEGILFNRYLPDDRRAFWLLDPDSGALEQLAIPSSFAIQLTAAAGQLVFVDSEHGGDLAAVDLVSGRQRTLAPSTFWEGDPAISPDGQRIAFASMRSGSREIWTVELDRNAPVRHSDFDGGFASHPRWSPDGGWLAFDVRDHAGSDVYLLDVDSSGPPIRLTHHAADDLVPTWSRDGTSVYFASDRTGSWQVWQRPLDGGAAVQVTRDGGFFALEDPANGDLVFTRRHAASFAGRQLWRRAADSARATPWTDVPAPADWGSWSIEAHRVVVGHRTDAGIDIVLLDRRTGASEILATLDGGLAGRSFGLHGEVLVYARPGPPSGDLMLVDGVIKALRDRSVASR